MNFSVVVPTYNRISSLRDTLDSLFALDYSDHEIIVVNDGSDDGTGEFLDELASRGLIVAVAREHAGPAAARNAGARVSRGRWLAFTDDDCTVPPEWLSGFERAFRETGAVFAGGSVHHAGERNLLAETTQEMTSFFVSYCAERGRCDLLTSNNVAYESSAFRAAGGFDERFVGAGGEERALNRAILAGGGTGAYCPEINVGHRPHMTFVDFLRKHARYGSGASMLRSIAGEASAIPVAAHAALLQHWIRSGAIGRCLLYGAAQAAAVAGFIAATGRAA